MIKKLLNKIKSIKNISAAFITGRIYSPYVRAVMEQAKEVEKQQIEVLFDGTALAEAVRELTIEAQKTSIAMLTMAQGIEKLEDAFNKQWKENRMNTNNWRKMHGLKMRRKRTRLKKNVFKN